LGAWQGHLLVDDYVGYKALFTDRRDAAPPCIELGCMAHARRKFFDLHHANQSPMAAEALARIGRLYAIEADGRALVSIHGLLSCRAIAWQLTRWINLIQVVDR